MDTINGTDFDENSVTELSTKSPSYFERCVKFNFENHFDSTFSSGSGFCTGANPWTLSNFTLLEINCFHPLSTSFIAPTSTFSCITSPNFLMSDGTLEFNVYMGNVSRSNFPLFWMIKILVQVKSHDGTDNTIATTSYNSHSDNFVPGWNTLKINVENLWQEGHIVLMGMKTEGSIVFIDSFRFIPSTMNDDMCTLYKNQITTPSLTTDDSESTKFTVTEAWKTESTNSGHETTENNQETNEQQTDATVSESFTRSTDFYDQETKTTVRDQWVTTAETITDSTVTESWITKTTNINNQETTMAGIWTLDPTSSTDTETESTDLNEDAATVTTVKEMWTTTSKPNSTECIKYDFEKDFDKLFSSRSGNCRGMTPWTLNNLTSVELESNLHPSSRLCISPKTSLSCVTSFSFLMGSGTLEFNVYIGDSQFSNAINILVMESSEGGFDSYFRNYMYTPMSPNFVLGWNVLRITFDSPRDFEGYVTFLGRQDSILLIDSFRYIPSTMNEEDCVVYDSKYTTPSISTVVSTTEMDTINGTDFDENSVTELSTKSPSYFERCVKFNFENHFDSTFSSGSGFCTGANPWTLSNFTLLEMNCFHPLSTSFIAPTSTFSCITSPNFLMSDGMLEFNVYMGNVSRSNFPLFWMIKILVQVKSHDGTDNTIATTSYNSHSVNFVPGWNTLKINVENLWQEGHVSFVIVLMGMKTEGSIVFIDSFRFIPSTMNDDMCTLYKNQITTPSLTTDDSESTKFTVTEAWKTESTNSGHETTENNQETNEQQTDATVSESFTRSTDFYDKETKTTVRDQWVTTADTITDSTVTESWITKTTNINNQETTMAGIWTLDPTSSKDTETESTDLNEDAATVTTVKEMWTTTSKPNSTECIKYDFEKDFDKLFSSRSGNCRGMTPWTLHNLTSVELESNLHPSSRLCISPKTSLSCVTSFSFLMRSGTLEFNVYIGDSQFSNAINILVMESSEGGFDSYFRNYMYTPMSPNFVLGWNVLRITLDSPRDFEGYIVLQGALAELNSVVLVDSFRYIPSTIHEELCKIYQGQ
ncbi:hypothetical protein ABMA27_009907 [Loxostege sticticalis]|uniref:Midgut protein n=1 Tax=Loxostege sticticalis TaxID=481309 RepID=A0ABR3H748_LOXSC